MTKKWDGITERRSVPRNSAAEPHLRVLFVYVREQKAKDVERERKADCMARKIDKIEKTLKKLPEEFAKTSTEGWTRVYKVVERIEREINERLQIVINKIDKIPCEPIQRIVGKSKKG